MYGLQKYGPIEDYALADLYTWLESHSEFTHIAALSTHPTSLLPAQPVVNALGTCNERT